MSDDVGTNDVGTNGRFHRRRSRRATSWMMAIGGFGTATLLTGAMVLAGGAASAQVNPQTYCKDRCPTETVTATVTNTVTSTVTTTAPGPTSTVTTTAPGPTSTVTTTAPGPTSTVTETVPGPTSTVTETVPGPTTTVTETPIVPSPGTTTTPQPAQTVTIAAGTLPTGVDAGGGTGQSAPLIGWLGVAIALIIAGLGTERLITSRRS